MSYLIQCQREGFVFPVNVPEFGVAEHVLHKNTQTTTIHPENQTKPNPGMEKLKKNPMEFAVTTAFTPI